MESSCDKLETYSILEYLGNVLLRPHDNWSFSSFHYSILDCFSVIIHCMLKNLHAIDARKAFCVFTIAETRANIWRR